MADAKAEPERMEPPPSQLYGSNAFSPQQIAERVETTGVAKANLSLVPMAVLGLLAGAFIGLGALYYTLVTSDPSLGFAVSRVLGGVVFSLGLVLVVVAGAELFTGNNLMVMAWVSRRISTGLLLRNFSVVYLANLAGASGLALLVYVSGHLEMADGAVGAHAVAIAVGKVGLSPVDGFMRGVLCNVLVCLAVWIASAARTVSGKILAIVFPISAFVAAGFEHSVANMYFIPLGMLVEGGPALDASGFLRNLVPVTLGNVAGGAGFVGMAYWLIYLRGKAEDEPRP